VKPRKPLLLSFYVFEIMRNSLDNADSQSHRQQAQLARLLSGVPELEFAVLVGSRALGTARAKSDWDIALQWRPQTDWLALLDAQETLRRRIADMLCISLEDIDLIDLSRVNLAMRASVAEDGIVLKGEDNLPWARFLTRTWRELEDYYWERAHAA
jgi:predicted nucleotidyltransferase